jgi:hypothetical protein
MTDPWARGPDYLFAVVFHEKNHLSPRADEPEAKVAAPAGRGVEVPIGGTRIQTLEYNTSYT